MPEISDLLGRAAPGAGGPAPLDDIVRRGRRRQVATRVAAAAPLAVVAVVATVIITGGGPTGVVIEPGPDVADAPDATPPPTPAEPGEPAESPEPPAGSEESPPEDTAGWVAPSGMRADLLVVTADGGTPQLQRLRADGELVTGDLADGVPNAAGLFPDGAGGIVWQPDWSSAEPAPILHRTADGNVTIVAESPSDGEYRLVGWDEALGRPLAQWLTGTSMETANVDLVALALDGSGHEVVRSGVGGWESGISHAVTREVALYDLYAEANQFVMFSRPDGDPQVVYEAGEITGEDVAGVALLPDDDRGVALVTTMAGLERDPAARLLFIDLATGAITDEVDVPLGAGYEGDAPWPGTTAREISVHDGHVLVNRWFEGMWVAPLVYDTASGDWSMPEHRKAGPVLGRAYLAAPWQDEAMAEQAACMAEDGHLRNAEPSADTIALYLPCKDETEPGIVYRVGSGIEPSGDVEADLAAALEQLIQPLPEDDGLTARGYYMPADRGQPVLRSVTVEDGHAVVDLGFPNGVGNLSAPFIGAVWSNALRGTVFQFPQVQTLELRRDGSCEDYGEAMQAGPACLAYDRDTDAPWNAA